MTDDVLWLARGLNREMTGIERFLISLLDDLDAAGIVARDRLTLVCDRDALWPDPLVRSGWRIARLSSRSPVRDVADAQIVHAFGRDRLPRRCPATRLYSVYDWGAFVNRALPLRTRIAWGSAIVWGVQRADITHFLNAALEGQRPRVVPRPKRSVVCYPGTRRPNTDSAELAAPTHALFVGTVSARKRVDAIVSMAVEHRVPVRLVGAGTEVFRGHSPHVVADGRASEAQLDDAYAHATAVLLLSEYEGFGIPILEAAQRGIHSVVSREVYDNLPEDLQAYCAVVDPDDSAALATAIGQAATRRGTVLVTDPLAPLREVYTEALQS